MRLRRRCSLVLAVRLTAAAAAVALTTAVAVVAVVLALGAAGLCLGGDACMQEAAHLVRPELLARMRRPLPGTEARAQALRPHGACTAVAYDDGTYVDEANTGVVWVPSGNRTSMCEWTDMCVDARRGVFVPDVEGEGTLERRATDPRRAADGALANLRTADGPHDYYWEPVLASLAADDAVHVVDAACTLYVQLTMYPYHLSHFLYNVALPALATRMATEGRDAHPTGRQPCSVWAPVRLFDAEREPRWRAPIEFAWLNFSHVLPMAMSNALLADDVASGDLFHSFQRIVPVPSVMPADLAGRPACFRRTVLGTGNTCPLANCASKPAPAVYEEARRLAYAFADQTEASSSSDPPPPRARGPVVVLVEREDTRRVANHADLLAGLRASGVNARSVTLKGASFADQVNLFRDAAVLLAPHGNANGNLLWMPPDGTLIEMFGFNYTRVFFEGIAREMGVRYMAWRCMDPSCSAGNAGLPQFYHDMVVSVPDVIALVHRALTPA